MKTNNIEQLIKGTPIDRYTYSIQVIQKEQSLYVLYNQNRKEIALNIDKKGKKFLYVFPNEIACDLFLAANKDMQKYKPNRWELVFFHDIAITRLQYEKIDSALMFPAPNGWGLNVTFDNLLKDIKKQCNAKIVLTINKQMLKELFDYLDTYLVKERGCKDDYTITKRFCKENNIDFENIKEWLQEHGGYCDCEILANVEDRIDKP